MATVQVMFIIFLNLISSTIGEKNIVMVLTDDLDLVLDGMVPLEKTRRLIGDQGATFTNCFVATPICCPNRASILTGRYQHNHHTVNNSIAGGCNSEKWRNKLEQRTFATILKNRLGYRTFYAGKYLNQYGKKAGGGPGHQPPGWDYWAGLIGNSQYYNYSLSINGKRKKYSQNPEDYLTDVISSMAVEFLNNSQAGSSPFLMVLSPPAPHAPFTPAVRHSDRFRDKKAKRTSNFNTPSQEDKHWLVRMGPSPLPEATIDAVDQASRRRWETLLAVDELVETIYNTLIARNLLTNTYLIFTSDNGFHLGQFSLPIDKRQPYETDIRVPLLIRGPGIPRGQISAPVSSVDLFATILDMAGTQGISDGVSMLSKNISHSRDILIEYHGEHSTRQQHTGCPSDRDMNLSQCREDMACKCQDSANNTYSCLRRLSGDYNDVFCVFDDSQHFIEVYDLNSDPDQMRNIVNTLKPHEKRLFKKQLKRMTKCRNISCVQSIKLNTKEINKN